MGCQEGLEEIFDKHTKEQLDATALAHPELAFRRQLHLYTS
jgi:hypothetical protein